MFIFYELIDFQKFRFFYIPLDFKILIIVSIGFITQMLLHIVNSYKFTVCYTIVTIVNSFTKMNEVNMYVNKFLNDPISIIHIPRY